LPVAPWVKLPACCLVMVRSVIGVTVVASLALLLLVLSSPPPLTVTELVTVDGALLETLTVTVMGG